jgi:DNA-binding protein HU-beta
VPGAKKTPKTGLSTHIPLYIRRAFPYHQFDLIVVWSAEQQCFRVSGSEKPCSERQFGRIRKRSMAEIKRLTQTQLVRELAGNLGVNNKVAKQFVESYADIAVRETKKNGVFVIPGIGRLVRVERKARTGRNPMTGESIKIPAKKVVKFRVAKSVKDAIVPPKKK